ncbi:S-layer homology domain-containing protein [Candidatus Formimonas warabiya]|uniref:S-layer protein n=1 Tax=Formimonas warabiya TaxID=1761012 RepID=A0A3G1KMD0_FORW1|nr:S-layer homology domain-containing protein [Candidatus Formimonas warabiya]ATW23621.1 S-layer protein [Candidatus Formimonas warabiya]
MNLKSKLVPFSTAAILTIALAGNSFAATTPFRDLSNVNAQEKIIALQENGYVKGISDGVFAPDHTITAAEGIQFIVNALKLNIDSVRFLKEPKATDYYPNANNDAWYANTLIVAAVNGLDLPADLDPSQEWTREEFTYHLIQALEQKENLPMINLVPVEIADQDQITVDYQGAIQRALAYHVVELDAGGNFYPKDKISRAETAEQIYQALEYVKAHPAPAPDSTGTETGETSLE